MPDKTRQHLLEKLAADARKLPIRPLTVAEERVTNLAGEGLSYKQIGHRLSMSPRTVQHHINTIAGLLPPDDCPALERVRIWSRCRVAEELVMLMHAPKPAA